MKEDEVWRHSVDYFPRSTVNFELYDSYFIIRYFVKIGALREVLPNQSVSIFVETSFELAK
ncbi:hypothetical protein [Rubritalea sp.]|uniref:hypothetical protein n=1 Tax=Rubritalea sp. TaxID=2109375 RepID=UPI003EF45BC9